MRPKFFVPNNIASVEPDSLREPLFDVINEICWLLKLEIQIIDSLQKVSPFVVAQVALNCGASGLN